MVRESGTKYSYYNMVFRKRNDQKADKTTLNIHVRVIAHKTTIKPDPSCRIRLKDIRCKNRLLFD